MNRETPGRTRPSLILLLCVVGMMQCASWASAQTPSKEDQSSDSEGLRAEASASSGGGVAVAAADLRIAGDSFERFGKSLERFTTNLTNALTESSENLANMSKGFDPLGLKQAFTTLDRQNQTIQKLQLAEIERLKKECAKLKKELARLKKQTKRQK